MQSLRKKYAPVIVRLSGSTGKRGARTMAKRIVKMIRDAEGKEDALRFFRRSVVDVMLFRE